MHILIPNHRIDFMCQISMFVKLVNTTICTKTTNYLKGRGWVGEMI